MKIKTERILIYLVIAISALLLSLTAASTEAMTRIFVIFLALAFLGFLANLLTRRPKQGTRL